MTKAIWNNVVLAESDQCEIVEGNYYFPPDSINQEYFKPSSKQTSCFWKGQANYYNIEVNGETNKDAAWYYANPKEKAKHIANYVAFWRGVQVKS